MKCTYTINSNVNSRGISGNQLTFIMPENLSKVYSIQVRKTTVQFALTMCDDLYHGQGYEGEGGWQKSAGSPAPENNKNNNIIVWLNEI